MRRHENNRYNRNDEDDDVWQSNLPPIDYDPDEVLLERDYSLGNGVSMEREEFAHRQNRSKEIAKNNVSDFREAANRGDKSGADLSMGRFGGISGDNYRRQDPFHGDGYRDRTTGVPGSSWNSGLNKEPGPHYGKGPKGWQRSDDRVREEVCEALYLSPIVDASEIEVSVKDGVVSLRGSVESRSTKREAERCVEHLHGVLDVSNELPVS